MRNQAVNIALCAAVVSVLVCSATRAQIPNAPTITGDVVLGYLQRDVFLDPGRGFREVQIGQSFDRVAKVWGRPIKTKTRILTRSKRWMYRSDDGTLLILQGKNNIEKITVEGNPSSAYQTVDGVRFGMTPREVVGFYSGARPRGKIQRLSYPRRGIAFDFRNGKLRSMHVTTPAAP